jgi:hypothetical protein
MPQGIVPVTADRRLDASGSGSRTPADEREVTPVEPAFPDQILEPGVGVLGTRDDEETRGVAIESVDDPGTIGVLPAGDPEVEQRVHEGSLCMAGRRMDDDPGRLVDDEEVLVLKGDPQLALLGFERDGLGLRHRDLEGLPALEPVTLRAPLAVDADGAGFQQPLGLAAGSDLRERGEEPVQPLSGGPLRDFYG